MNLFSALEIKKYNLRNRVVIPPMARSLAKPDGEVTDELLSHYEEISRYPGLTIVEHSYVSERGRYSQNQLGVNSDNLIPSLKKLSEKIKENGSISALQINHSGPRADRKVLGNKPLAPSEEGTKKEVEALNKEKMNLIKEKFGEAAERAVKAGFDAIEVHGAHGFLLNSFTSPLTNKRDDEYGGSLKNRSKFPLEVVKEVKDRIGDKLLLYRIGATDHDTNGLKISEAKKLSKKLENKGVDIIDVSGGLCGSRPKELQEKEGYFVPEAKEIKNAVNAPVIGVGGIKDPKKANKFIKKQKVDLVAVGRANLKDPKWIKRARKELI
ncbi:MAG: NADH:flavin oxidoreductase, Old Yellow Enzyme family NemA [Candidatus Methanohalarchaeum thermophilum]|uniref:NADH:flavin oxidoreductase, Old Yellow Enzyme family NemA n=1 Tax=Methanohalarchaeum thermophilum TaxID=1903181 RepID=A0A1Q6DVD5_METT1|nr:MAG: NADH:flavin oxidoreductase, Old Yellow Enzyme family NemA [Candidatus Methanohalarchaeum thermophilum]